MTNLKYLPFVDVDLTDPFFDSLKADYAEFPSWFKKKAAAGEAAYLFRHKGKIDGFLYLKLEEGTVEDIAPPLKAGRHLKIGTLKINAHGTKLGERFVKKVFDHALALGVDDVYVTAFAKHAPLIAILKRYGFAEFASKAGPNGVEVVLLKDFHYFMDNVLLDYPKIKRNASSKYLLAIYPEYHTRFLPDSKLNNESFDIVQDVSHANSIHKIYISGVPGTGKLSSGDLLVMYRTTDIQGKAYYRSVATSIGVVEETRKISSFNNEIDFLKYVRPYSVFEQKELADYYATKKRHVVIKFTYNIALRRRLIRKRLIEEVGLPGERGRRWDFLRLTEAQFNSIFNLGEANESYIVD